MLTKTVIMMKLIIPVAGILLLAATSCNRKEVTCKCVGGWADASYRTVKAAKNDKPEDVCRSMSSPPTVDDGITCELK